MFKDSTTKNIILLTALVGVFIASVCIFWYWAQGTVGAFKSVQVTNQSFSSVAEQKLDKLRRELKSVQPHIDKLRSAAITRDNVPTVLNAIELTGGELTDMYIDNVAADEAEALARVTVSFDCDMAICIDVVTKVMAVRPIVGLDSLQMRQVEGGVWAVTMSIRIPLVELNKN